MKETAENYLINKNFVIDTVSEHWSQKANFREFLLNLIYDNNVMIEKYSIPELLEFYFREKSGNVV